MQSPREPMSSGDGPLRNPRAGDGSCAFDVVIPTRNRPAKLERCLIALAAARSTNAFHIYVVDSSQTAQARRAVDAACETYPFVSIHRHQKNGFAAARNECSGVGTAPLILSVDDDVYVESSALDRMLERYEHGTGWRVVAGSVFWGDVGSSPVRMRRIGYGAGADESDADFYVTALLLYPRSLAIQCPFNEKIAFAEDRFMGSMWRSKKVDLLWASTALAKHDDEHRAAPIHSQASHIYANLFDALCVRRNLGWALSFEFLGFAAGMKFYGPRPLPVLRYCIAWLRGNLMFARDWAGLRQTAAARLTGCPPELVSS